jgi:maltose alpha-D-glucosyltransferase / alpha-amylase
MAFHFPLMPRMYMALAQEDRHPITDIMRQTPEIPDNCQWAIFLRNHDELTLEMVTDRERDYLWSFYASDRRARINLGIRRRLAPLLDNDRRKIELMNSLLLSMPGTPVSTTATRSAWATTTFSAIATACARRCNGRRTAMAVSPAPCRSSSICRTGIADILTADASARLSREVLPNFLPLQRWFGAKGERIKASSIRTGPVLDRDYCLATVEIQAAESGSQTYFLPLRPRWGEENLQFGAPTLSATLAKLRRTNRLGALVDAAADPSFAEALVEAMRTGADLAEGGLLFHAESTERLKDIGHVDEARPLGVEQSNVTLAFGDKGLLKVYRRLRAGRQPDIEIVRFLTEKTDFRNTPAFLGEATLKAGDSDPATIAACFAFVPNQGDGWKAVVDALVRELQDRSLAESGEAQADPEDGRFPFPLDLADTFGRRTAELHIALASPTDDPAFGTRPITRRDIIAWAADTRRQARDAFRRLASASPTPEIDELLRRRRAIETLIRRLATIEPRGLKSRIHGDFHLGQVLIAQTDIMIIDFEGEPRRNLAERRALSSPMRDVAGMLRSFDYAAFAAIDHVRALGIVRSDVEAVAWQWRDRSVSRFLGGYGKARDIDAAGLGDDNLLKLFVLQKALYEIGYEAANRPSWLATPVRGVLALLEERTA